MQEIEKRLENVRQHKLKRLAVDQLETVRKLVDEELFLKEVMVVEMISETMDRIWKASDDVTAPPIKREPFLNLYLGISTLDFPCKKLITHTVFKKNKFGMNHPFIIIGPYKMDWNDSSLVKIKYDQFMSRGALMVYKFHTIMGEENVTKALVTVARVCTFWNAYKVFSKLGCNCHHFIKYLLGELAIESPIDDSTSTHNPILNYIFTKLRLCREERCIPLKSLNCRTEGSSIFFNMIDKSSFASEVTADHFEIQLEGYQRLLQFQQFLSQIDTENSSAVEKDIMWNMTQCLTSYLNGYQLRHQGKRSLDYRTITELKALCDRDHIHNIELEYPFTNGDF